MWEKLQDKSRSEETQAIFTSSLVFVCNADLNMRLGPATACWNPSIFAHPPYPRFKWLIVLNEYTFDVKKKETKEINSDSTAYNDGYLCEGLSSGIKYGNMGYPELVDFCNILWWFNSSFSTLSHDHTLWHWQHKDFTTESSTKQRLIWINKQMVVIWKPQ